MKQFGRKILAMVVLVTVCLAAIPCGLAEGEAKVIEIWRPSNNASIEAWWDMMLASFNEQYAGQYEVKLTAIPKGGADGYENKVNTAVISDSLPDLILVDGPNVASYAENGIIVPLDELVSEEDKSDMLESIVKQGSYKGSLYALGLWESSVALFYNKDVLEAAGVEVPTKIEEAWTWSDVLEVAKKVQTNDIFGINLSDGTSGEFLTYAYSPIIVEYGSDLVSEDGSTFNGYVNGEAAITALTKLQSFFTEGVANVAPNATEFHEGKAAMMISGSYSMATLNDQYPEINWGVTYYPAADDGTLRCATGSWVVAITKNCKDKEAAYVFADYMTNTAANITGCPASGYMPPRKSSLAELSQYNEYPYSIFMEQLVNYGAPRPITPSYTVLSPKFSEAVADIFKGSDVKSKLDTVAKLADDDYQMNYGIN